MEFLQHNIIWVAVAALSGGMLLWPLLTGSSAKGVTPGEATLLMNRAEAVVLDIRETGEWDSGHIAGARHIALAQLDKRLSEIDKFKTRPLIVVCESGSRSAGACGQLKKAGFENVQNLAGGLAAWRSAGLPLTTKG